MRGQRATTWHCAYDSKITVVCRQKLVLLVVPTSVITNWQREFSTWGAFGVAIYHGPKEARSAALQSIQIGTAEILITSYDLYRRAIH